MRKTYDFIIIGSGFGGSVAALRLVEKGYSVLVIEKGKRYRSEDFPKTNWNLRKYLWIPALRFFGFQKLTFYRQVSILSGVGVGGGSLVYANTLLIPTDDYFRHQSWAGFKNWKKILLPYYKKAGFMMGRVKYEKLHIEDEMLREVARDFDRAHTFDTVYVGVNLNNQKNDTDPYFNGYGPLRKTCTDCGGCMVGCRENAKNTLDKNYLYFAEKFGAFILDETYADKIEYINGEYIVKTKSSTGLFNKSKNIFISKGLILAGGSLGTMELLLKQKYKYKTLPGLSGRLGENVLTNSETLSAVSGIKQKMNNGLAITSVFNPDSHTHIEIVKYPDGSNALKWFFCLSARGTSPPYLRIFRLIGKTILNPIAFLKTVFNFNWSNGLVIFLVMQHIENYMRFVWKKNLFGGKMAVNNTSHKKVPAYIDVGQKVMEAYASKTGGIAQNIILEIMFNRPTTAHILGGCPMSDTIANGVIDDKFRVHGYPGMYIADGSAMQGNPGVNPSLSILAIAEYIMDQIPEKAGHKHTNLKKLMQNKKSTIDESTRVKKSE
jgi:cholesterol oxidase